MALEHATHTTLKITRFDSEEWLNYNKKERSKPLKNEPNCLKPGGSGCATVRKPRRHTTVILTFLETNTIILTSNGSRC